MAVKDRKYPKMRLVRGCKFGINPKQWSPAEIREKFEEIVDDWMECFGKDVIPFQANFKMVMHTRKMYQSLGVCRRYNKTYFDIGIGSRTFKGRFHTLETQIDAVVGVIAHEVCHMMDRIFGEHKIGKANSEDFDFEDYYLLHDWEYRAEQFAARHSKFIEGRMVQINNYAEENDIEIPTW